MSETDRQTEFTAGQSVSQENIQKRTVTGPPPDDRGNTTRAGRVRVVGHTDTRAQKARIVHQTFSLRRNLATQSVSV